MNQKEILNVSGDLKKELKEIRKLNEIEETNAADLFTKTWSDFLTIFCC